MRFVRLSVYAQRRRITYNRAFNEALTGAVPARLVNGHWFVGVGRASARRTRRGVENAGAVEQGGAQCLS